MMSLYSELEPEKTAYLFPLEQKDSFAQLWDMVDPCNRIQELEGMIKQDFSPLGYFHEKLEESQEIAMDGET